MISCQRFICLILAAATWASAQPANSPILTVDLAANRNPISPYVYGINFSQDVAAALRIPAVRWGGNSASRYNWKIDARNTAADWYFENFPQDGSVNPANLPDGSAFDKFFEQNNQIGAITIGTIPMMGLVPKSREAKVCSFSVKKYGPQQHTDQYAPDCGNGMTLDGKSAIRNNDPFDTSVSVDENFMSDWVRHMVGKYGTADNGGVAIWELDNEPVWWHGVHRDIHPAPSTYDEVLIKGLRYARAVKNADPSAKVAGPVSGGWSDYFYSALDMTSGWAKAPYKYYDNPVDRNAHGGTPFLEWYLQTMRDYERQSGVRLLDYLDIHGYISPVGGALGNKDTQALRLRSTRAFWDPAYSYNHDDTNEPPRLIPRMHDWVSQNYPGTKLAITEYTWGALNTLNGALAQADILGIFGREGLDVGTLWDSVKVTDPGAFAFRMFLNYDGQGSAFGNTSVSATTTDADSLSIFAAQRADGTLTVIVINKTDTDQQTTVNLANFTPAGPTAVYRYTGADLTTIVRDTDLTATTDGVTSLFPASSITLLEIASQ